MKFAGLLRGTNKGGSMQALSNAFYVENADEAIFYFTAATNYDFSQLNFDATVNPLDKCKKIFSQQRTMDYEALKQQHVL